MQNAQRTVLQFRSLSKKKKAILKKLQGGCTWKNQSGIPHLGEQKINLDLERSPGRQDQDQRRE